MTDGIPAGAGGAAMDPERPLSEPFDPKPRRPKVDVPAGACDCHAHVFGPGNAYPFIPHGLYTPADALPADFLGLLDALGLARGVLVQPSIYAQDNRAMLDALAPNLDRLRGIAVLPFDVGAAEVERLHGLGIRGVRCNIVDLRFDKGVLPLDGLKALAATIRPFGWHVEFLMHVNEFPDLDRQLADFPTEVCFGHLGYVKTEHGADTEGFRAMLRLLRDGKAWVKLTAPYRLTLSAMPYADVDETARILVEAAPDRLLWGSDWPHTYIKTAMPNDGDLFDLFVDRVPDAGLRKRILVDNPERLYGF
ncbi:amidohydrolase family protein [Faunimonas sp. B44]|uniref:amidohydrolase family protein n=1 Tax=Faunimonas sp. B44 TaxID=3461493 RepID=UPI00404496E5